MKSESARSPSQNTCQENNLCVKQHAHGKLDSRTRWSTRRSRGKNDVLRDCIRFNDRSLESLGWLPSHVVARVNRGDSRGEEVLADRASITIVPVTRWSVLFTFRGWRLALVMATRMRILRSCLLRIGQLSHRLHSNALVTDVHPSRHIAQKQ